jgi:hypothetical protein
MAPRVRALLVSAVAAVVGSAHTTGARSGASTDGSSALKAAAQHASGSPPTGAKLLVSTGITSHTSKCRCGAVEKPVLPERPISSPAWTCCPTRTHTDALAK